MFGLSVVIPSAGAHAAAALHARTYAYGKRARQSLDAYWNTSARGTQPGLVLLHGGLWNGGSKKDWKSTAQWYAKQGFAVFAVDHRFNTDAAWPAPRDDAFAAVRWIRSHAGSFRLDRNRIAVLGAQSGGELAAQLGTRGGGVRAVVGLSPIASPELAYTSAQTTAASATRRKLRDQTVVLGDCSMATNEARCHARYRDMNPATYASGDDAPMYLVHSAGDPIPVRHSEQLRDALVQHGDRDVTVRTVSGKASGGALLDSSLRSKTLSWLRAHTGVHLDSTAAPQGQRLALAGEREPAITSSDNGSAESARVAATAARVEHTYAYGPYARNRLDAIYRKSRKARPALVLIHGGYWYEGDKSAWTNEGRWFSDRGYAVFTINYRLNTQARWPAQRNDLYRAIGWVTSHAHTFAVNPKRVVLVGSSAGGQMATAVGTRGKGAKTVKAVAALSPVVDPYRGYRDGQTSRAGENKRKLRDAGVLLTRCTPERSNKTCWKRWVDLVVYNGAGKGDVPMYIMHSAGDFVPAGPSHTLCAKLNAAKVSCAVRTLPGDRHGIALLGMPGARAALLKWIRAHD
ncbi:alpha/beta hydrolase [Actinomadura barringtoniae]|uniref:Alpha/beta hydrolase n=1 Tax=Actinomadura barringtoniae TaxID=1427535 RepID=A0A939PCR3_9ACTN|nr:alpha/beta hydrolase [Actinomadura barringtoniae]MBO2450236.1 alpha/beta hydrolase [Actinomadura barringtoniae]